MPGNREFLYLSIAVGVPALIAAYTYWQAEQVFRRRRLQVEPFAGELGLIAAGSVRLPREVDPQLAILLGDEKPEQSYHEQLAEILSIFKPLSTKANRRRIECLLVGEQDGLDWFLFDYWAKPEQGQIICCSIVVARLRLVFPLLEVLGRDYATTIKDFTAGDVELESDEFNFRYRVNCLDRKLAYDIVHPQMMEHFLACEDRYWQIGHGFAVLQLPGLAGLDQYRQAMEDIKGFAALIPAFVKHDLRIRA